MSVAAYTDEIERERARQRTYDAMLRKAKAGHVTGGRVFGYDNVTVEVEGPDGSKHRSHVERKINEAEAEVIRRIFTLYAQGRGISAIAKVLNEGHVRCPRPQQGRPTGWAPSSLRAVLLRSLYRGRLIWNQTKKRDMWGVVGQTTRAEDEWISVHLPHLRIVSDELWEAVEQRFESMGRRSLRTAGGRLLGRPPGEGVKHLLAGLAKCTCGASIEARSRSHGRRRVVFYGCSAYHRKGKSVCANGLTLPAKTLEEAVLRSVEEAVLDPRVVEAALDKAVERITSRGDRERRLAELRKKLSSAEDELQRLVEAITQGGDLKTLTSAVREREERRDELQFSLDALLRDEWTGHKTNQQVRRDLQARIKEWRGLLRRHPVQGQQILRKLIDGRLTLTAHPEEVVAYYEFKGTGTLTGLLAGSVPHKLASPTGTVLSYQPVFRGQWVHPRRAA